ncbi:MAG: hypothetical protein JW881_21785 [Spirochaetales bacterium]|nr:hypothetical protein [Spirochaetales bacterium]
MIGKAPGNIIKEYPEKGPMKQYRFDKAVAFACFRCGNEKKSKLITIYQSNWNKRLCNGCYGRLLSIYEIKAGTKSEDEKVDELIELLLKLVSDDELRIAIEKLKIKENRIQYLDSKTLRFVASAEYISSKTEEDYSLDWSHVIIGLCKAFENELVEKIIRPFKSHCKSIDISNDLKDNDLSRITKYISKENTKEPELGTFAHFLQTVLNSKSRRHTSNIIKTFYDFLTDFPYSNWILDKSGLLNAINSISNNFRNKAAHIEELGKEDFF